MLMAAVGGAGTGGPGLGAGMFAFNGLFRAVDVAGVMLEHDSGDLGAGIRCSGQVCQKVCGVGGVLGEHTVVHRNHLARRDLGRQLCGLGGVHVAPAAIDRNQQHFWTKVFHCGGQAVVVLRIPGDID